MIAWSNYQFCNSVISLCFFFFFCKPFMFGSARNSNFCYFPTLILHVTGKRSGTARNREYFKMLRRFPCDRKTSYFRGYSEIVLLIRMWNIMWLTLMYWWEAEKGVLRPVECIMRDVANATMKIHYGSYIYVAKYSKYSIWLFETALVFNLLMFKVSWYCNSILDIWR